jgi:hypothetical protein
LREAQEGATVVPTQPGDVTDVSQRAHKNTLLPSAESIMSVGGLVSVVVGVAAITVLAVATMAFIDSGRDATILVPLSTSAFGVISAIVGAYLGIKIGTDQSRSIAADASQAHATLTASLTKQISDLQASGTDTTATATPPPAAPGSPPDAGT